MPRYPKTTQLDLFSTLSEAETAHVPQWQALPEETRHG